MNDVLQDLEKISQVVDRLKKIFTSAQSVNQSQYGRSALSAAGQRITSGRQDLERLENTLIRYVNTEPPAKPVRRRKVGPKETK